MDTRWFTYFKATDEEARTKVKASLKSAKLILDAAIELLNQQKAAMERPRLEDYDSPSWSHKQAHINGELAMLNKVTALLTIKDI